MLVFGMVKYVHLSLSVCLASVILMLSWQLIVQMLTYSNLCTVYIIIDKISAHDGLE